MSKVLFVYYSYTQNTRTVADTMADVLRKQGHEVAEAAIEFTDPKYGAHFQQLPMKMPLLHITGMLSEQRRKKIGEIGIPPEAAEGGYDLVVLGAPTWWLTTCMPMRSYLNDDAATKVLDGTPFAVFTTSRRYFRDNIKTMRTLGEAAGGRYIDETHFVSDGNQVMSMWSWLAFMHHNQERAKSFGVRMPKPNLKAEFTSQAVSFIESVARTALRSRTT
jgi:flavodoxin